MKSLESIYNAGFFKRRNSLNWRVNIVCDAIIQSFPMVFGGTKGKKSIKIVDVGCGIADYVAEFNRLGYTAVGIEGSEEVKPFLKSKQVYFNDLRKPLMLGCLAKSFDLCYSLEVAEHIEENYTDQYIDNLCFLSNTILITAAGPGQGGHYHVNLQEKEYWQNKFGNKLYYRNELLERRFLSILEPHKRKKGINSYYQNAMIFERMLPILK